MNVNDFPSLNYFCSKFTGNTREKTQAWNWGVKEHQAFVVFIKPGKILAITH